MVLHFGIYRVALSLLHEQCMGELKDGYDRSVLS